MKRSFLNSLFSHSLLIVVLTSASLFASEKADGQEWARSMFEKFEHDFGQVVKGDLPVYKFKITNKFKEDIRIRGVYSSCGCTTATVSKNILKSWETGELVCRFNSPAFDDFKQATVTVVFDYPFAAEVQLNVRGTIVNAGGLQLNPRELDFGRASAGQHPMQVVNISKKGDPNFRIEDVKSTFKHVGVRPKQTARNGNLVAYQLEIRMKDTLPPGPSQGELYVIVNDNNRLLEVPVKFRASVAAPLQVTPSVLTLSPVSQGEEVKRKVILKADTPFHIRDVTSRSANFRVRADRSAFKKVHFVDVVYFGEDDPGRHENELNFVTDLADSTVGKMKAIVEVVEKSAEGDE